jgi:hypothetical protein
MRPGARDRHRDGGGCRDPEGGRNSGTRVPLSGCSERTNAIRPVPRSWGHQRAAQGCYGRQVTPPSWHAALAEACDVGHMEHDGSGVWSIIPTHGRPCNQDDVRHTHGRCAIRAANHSTRRT